jgi:ribosomal protein S20
MDINQIVDMQENENLEEEIGLKDAQAGKDKVKSIYNKYKNKISLDYEKWKEQVRDYVFFGDENCVVGLLKSSDFYKIKMLYGDTYCIESILGELLNSDIPIYFNTDLGYKHSFKKLPNKMVRVINDTIKELKRADVIYSNKEFIKRCFNKNISNDVNTERLEEKLLKKREAFELINKSSLKNSLKSDNDLDYKKGADDVLDKETLAEANSYLEKKYIELDKEEILMFKNNLKKLNANQTGYKFLSNTIKEKKISYENIKRKLHNYKYNSEFRSCIDKDVAKWLNEKLKTMRSLAKTNKKIDKAVKPEDIKNE